jgi:hypothetical protein
MRYELNDFEWAAIKLMLPNKPRGLPRVNDRRVLNGIFWVLRSGPQCTLRHVISRPLACPDGSQDNRYCAHSPISFSHSSSVSTATPSSRALVSLEPASSPATT